MDNLAVAPDFDPTEFAPLSLLEQGDVDMWVRRRGAILINKSKETAKDCEAGKLVDFGGSLPAIMQPKPYPCKST